MKITRFLLFLEKSRVIRLFSWIYSILKAENIFKKEKKKRNYGMWKNAHLALY